MYIRACIYIFSVSYIYIYIHIYRWYINIYIYIYIWIKNITLFRLLLLAIATYTSFGYVLCLRFHSVGYCYWLFPIPHWAKSNSICKLSPRSCNLNAPLTPLPIVLWPLHAQFGSCVWRCLECTAIRICIYTNSNSPLCKYVDMYINVCIYIYVYIYTNICHVYTPMYIYIHCFIYIYIYSYL